MVKVMAPCAVALALAVPQSAQGAVVFGADLSQSVSTPGGCAAAALQPCSYFTETTSANLPEAGSPMTGALVSVRLRHYNNAQPLLISVRVLRPTGTAGEYLNVGPEIPVIAPIAATTGGEVTEYAIHRVIAAGDRIGIGFTKPTYTFGFLANGAPRACRFRVGPGAEHAVDTAASYDTAGCQGEVLISGTVEPDADADGFGDETQDGCPASAAHQGDCPVPAQGRDTRPPRLTLGGSRRQRALAKRRVFVYAISDEAATLAASGTISIPGAARVLKLGSAARSVVAREEVRLGLRLGRKLVRRVRRALRHGLRVRARVRVLARDAAGNVGSARRMIRLKRGR